MGEGVEGQALPLSHVEVQRSFDQPLDPSRPSLSAIVISQDDRERIQEFKGTVIRMRKGGNNANFTVRRTASNGIGVERTFLMLSPRIDKVVVDRHTHVRRAQLYFLRGLTGKKAHLKQKFE